MKFYTQQHDFYYGIDLHARTMYLCILGVWCSNAHNNAVIQNPNQSQRTLDDDAMLTFMRCRKTMRRVKSAY